MNIVNDVRAAVQFLVDRRKARKEPVQQVKHREPSVSFYDTVEGCVIGNLAPDICKASASAFRALPYETKHRLAFAPKNGEFCERAQLWKEALQPVMSQKQYAAAMIAILRWYRHTKTSQRKNEVISHIEEKLYKYGQAFEAKGKKDAASGAKPYTVVDIEKWVEKKVPNCNPEAAELFADIMLGLYMDGYNGGAEA